MTEHSDTETVQLINTEDDAIPSASTNFSAVEAILQTRERERGNIMHNRSFDISLLDLCATPRINLKEKIIMHWHNRGVVSSELATVANIVLGAPAT